MSIQVSKTKDDVSILQLLTNRRLALRYVPLFKKVILIH